MKIIFFTAFITISIFTLTAQKVEWASKILNAKNVEYEYEDNSFDYALGPPVVYSSVNMEDEKHDLYADGYLILPNRNKNLMVDFGFRKPVIANKIYLGGVFNAGVIKKCILILKDNKLKQVYSVPKIKDEEKKLSFTIDFPTETVYGLRLVIDHTKADDWNILKGVGLYKSSAQDTVSFKPDLFEGLVSTIRKEKLGNNINTKICAEFNPKLSSDATKLFFVRECGDKKQEQIWMSEGADNVWNEPTELGSPLNNSGHNYVVSTALDSRIIFVGNVYNDKGEEIGPGLSKSTWEEDSKTWSIPQKIDLPSLLNTSEMENYFVTPDQQAIIVAMERPDGYGKMDLYVSLYNKYRKGWDEPINLGPDINTEFVEDFPYLSFDGKTLFFSSTGRIGYGGYDVYVSTRLDNSWQKWSKPKNLGNNINSKTDDFGFTVSSTGDVAYFSTVSIEGEHHNVDIYKVALPKELQQPALVSLKGKVSSEKTGLGLQALVRIKEQGAKNDFEDISCDNEGRFTAVLYHGRHYQVIVEAPNYFKSEEVLPLLEDSYKGTLIKNYKLSPFLDSGQVAVLQNIRFKFGGTVIADESQPALDGLYKMLQEQKNMIVEIAGHTDDVGSDTFNLKLSRWRAAAVVDYLLAKGIRPWRLKFVGFGETVPIAPNDSEEGRALNRRVEMVILDNDVTKKYKKNKPDKPAHHKKGFL